MLDIILNKLIYIHIVIVDDRKIIMVLRYFYYDRVKNIIRYNGIKNMDSDRTL